MKATRLAMFVLFAVVAAAVFVRLGFWQLHRLHERRAYNALVMSRLDSAEIDVTALPHDTALARFRRVRIAGVPDYAHELLWAARSYNGSPGVNLFTPIRIPGRDTAVLVDRGWVYAPDGAMVDESKWHETDSAFTGFAEPLPSTGGATYAGKPNILARLSVDVVRKALPYPVAPIYVVVLGDSAIAPDRVARLAIPPLTEGPHLSYAIQWFAFATISIAGMVIVVVNSRRGSTDLPGPPPRPGPMA